MPPRPLVNKTKASGVWELGVGSWKFRFGREKTNRSGNFLRRGGVAIQNQFGVAAKRGREAGNVGISSRNGLDMNCARIFVSFSALRVPHLQRGAERRGVLNQQPVARRDKRDAVAVNQRPFHHTRIDFSSLGFGQQIGERGFGVARGKFRRRRRGSALASGRLVPPASASRGRQWFRRE